MPIIPEYVEGFPWPSATYTAVQPFTYRDGTTYLEILAALDGYVKSLPGGINGSYESIANYLDDSMGALQSAVNASLNSMGVQVDGEVQRMIDAVINNSVELQDPAMSHLVGDPTSMTREAMDSVYGLWVSVKNFGAVSDTNVDSTQAFQGAINFIDSKGGGTLFIPPGEYWVHGRVEMCDNLTIYGYGATLTKRGDVPSAGYAVFRSKQHSVGGYGAGGQNIKAMGVTFKGSFDAFNSVGCCGFALHHTDNVTLIDLKFDEAIIQGHGVDAIGCRGLVIENTEMYGFKEANNGYSRIECLQIGRSVEGSESAPDPTTAFDGLPCVDVTIRGVRSYGKTVEGVRWPSPNPVGSHNAALEEGELPDSNVLVDDVLVTECVAYLGSTPTRGIIHFAEVDGLTVKNCKFVREDVASTFTAVGVYGDSNNITIENIEVAGVTNNNAIRPIYLNRPTNGGTARVRDITVRSSGEPGTVNTECVRVVNYFNVIVDGVVAPMLFRPVAVTNAGKCAVSGVVSSGAATDAISLSDCTSVDVSGCDLTGSRGACVSAYRTLNARVTGNRLLQVGGGVTTREIVCSSGATNVTITGNVLGASSTSLAGVRFYDSSEGSAVILANTFRISSVPLVSNTSGITVIALANTRDE